jgi:hypothetical protein
MKVPLNIYMNECSLHAGGNGECGRFMSPALGDPVHAGDKALMRETPAQRGRVNRYVLDILITYTCSYVQWYLFNWTSLDPTILFVIYRWLIYTSYIWTLFKGQFTQDASSFRVPFRKVSLSKQKSFCNTWKN